MSMLSSHWEFRQSISHLQKFENRIYHDNRKSLALDHDLFLLTYLKL